MSNPLHLTSQQVVEQMSIAGEPDKVFQIVSDFFVRLGRETNLKNIPTIENAEFALKRIQAELKLMKRHERERQRIKIE